MYNLVIVQVAPNSTIVNDDGASLVVDDEHAVMKGNVCYVTPRVYERLRLEIPTNERPPSAGT